MTSMCNRCAGTTRMKRGTSLSKSCCPMQALLLTQLRLQSTISMMSLTRLMIRRRKHSDSSLWQIYSQCRLLGTTLLCFSRMLLHLTVKARCFYLMLRIWKDTFTLNLGRSCLRCTGGRRMDLKSMTLPMKEDVAEKMTVDVVPAALS